MRLAAIPLLGLLLAGAAGAQQVPVGSGVLFVEERLAAGRSCESYRRPGFAGFAVFPNGSFLLANDAGRFTGFLSPANARGTAWKLYLDSSSRAFYGLYVEAGVSALCGKQASVSGEIESFVLRVGRDGRISLRLSASARTDASSTGRARHLIRGSGTLGPLFVPTGAGGSHGGTVTLISPGRLQDPAEDRDSSGVRLTMISHDLSALTEQ